MVTTRSSTSSSKLSKAQPNTSLSKASSTKSAKTKEPIVKAARVGKQRATPHSGKGAASDTTETNPSQPQFWLMKAEPDARMEKGHNVAFSIEDLRAATEPEPWDGVRNLVARNNMRSMRLGELAFFYHSNCKIPGIVGMMEIVREHEPDESAFDPEHPYFDPKSERDRPKWSAVHVTFREKYPVMLSLREMQQIPALQEMQVLRQTRLSVSRVTAAEYATIIKAIAAKSERAEQGEE